MLKYVQFVNSYFAQILQCASLILVDDVDLLTLAVHHSSGDECSSS